MTREIFKNLPDTSTPLSASKLNGLLNGEESMGSIVVEDVTCKNLCPGVSQGYYLTTAGTSFGRTTTDNGLVIKVEENTDYTISTTDTQARYRIAFTNTLLSIGGSSSDVYNALTKDGTKENITRNSGTYKYLIVNATDLSKIQVEEGNKATDYTSHKKFGYDSTNSMGEIVVDGIVCKNIYDSYSYPLVINNAINGDDGTIYSSSANWYATVEYIPVNKYAGKNIISSSDSTTICFYDSNKVFISSIKKQGVVPTNSYYMRFDTHKDYANELYIELGTELTGYVEYQKFGKESVTNWTILNNDYGLRYRKVGNDVELSLIKSDTAVTITKNGALIELGTLPVECRPSTNIFIPVTNGGNLYGSLRLLIYSSGVISLQNLATSDVTFTYANAFTKYSALASAIA